MASKRPVTDEAAPLGVDGYRWRVCSAGYIHKNHTYLDLGSSLNVFQKGDLFIPKAAFDAASNVWEERDWQDTPALFRKFAAIHPTPEGVLSFANQYGLLSPMCVLADTKGAPAPLDELNEVEMFKCESLDGWRRAITEMRSVLGAWDAMTTDKDGELKKWITRPDSMDSETARAFASRDSEDEGYRNPWYLVLRSYDGTPGFFFPFDSEDEQTDSKVRGLDRWEAAQRAILFISNIRIAHTCYPHVVRRPRIQDANAAKVYTVKVRPKNLLGLLWWQFAMVITGEATYRPCKVCGKMIQLAAGGEGFRSDREFCSDPCKYKDFRDRKRKARELNAEGRTIPQIAKELATDKATIANWLAKKK